MSKIDNFSTMLRLRAIYKRLSQLTWTVKTIEDKYSIETVTSEKTETLLKNYLELGSDLEEAFKDWQKIYKEYKKNGNYKSS